MGLDCAPSRARSRAAEVPRGRPLPNDQARRVSGLLDRDICHLPAIHLWRVAGLHVCCSPGLVIIPHANGRRSASGGFNAGQFRNHMRHHVTCSPPASPSPPPPPVVTAANAQSGQWMQHRDEPCWVVWWPALRWRSQLLLRCRPRRRQQSSLERRGASRCSLARALTPTPRVRQTTSRLDATDGAGQEGRTVPADPPRLCLASGWRPAPLLPSNGAWQELRQWQLRCHSGQGPEQLPVCAAQ